MINHLLLAAFIGETSCVSIFPMTSARKKGKPSRWSLYEPPRVAPFFQEGGPPRQLVREPAPLALLGASASVFIGVVILTLLSLAGVALDPIRVITGLALTFLVAYTSVGFLAWYVLLVWERETARQAETSPDHVQGSEQSGSREG